MANLADSIEVNRQGRSAVIVIDGAEFPWWVTGAVTVVVDDAEVPGITITIPANRVLVKDQVGSGPQKI